MATTLAGGHIGPEVPDAIIENFVEAPNDVFAWRQMGRGALIQAAWPLDTGRPHLPKIDD